LVLLGSHATARGLRPSRGACGLAQPGEAGTKNFAGKSESRNPKSETIDEKSKLPKKKAGLLSI
jgi:hypothetical protein